jgi:chromosome partitioning protein
MVHQTLKLALISRKGSVGKTTTAVNLGAALAAVGKKVLLIDLDAQASASLSLGNQRGQLAPSMADVLAGTVPLGDAIRRTRTPGLDLVTGSCDLATFDVEMARTRNGEQCLRRPLESVEGRYDVILIDCPANLSLLPTAALVASTAYLVALSPQFLVFDGLENFLNTVERQRFRLGSKSYLLGLLLTQVDYRTRTARPYVQQIRQEFGERVLQTEVRVNVRLAEAPSFGQTIFEYEEDSSGAEAYRQLAKEVLSRNQRFAEITLRSAPTPCLPAEPAAEDRRRVPTLKSWATLAVAQRSEV